MHLIVDSPFKQSSYLLRVDSRSTVLFVSTVENQRFVCLYLLLLKIFFFFWFFWTSLFGFLRNFHSSISFTSYSVFGTTWAAVLIMIAMNVVGHWCQSFAPPIYLNYFMFIQVSHHDLSWFISYLYTFDLFLPSSIWFIWCRLIAPKYLVYYAQTIHIVFKSKSTKRGGERGRGNVYIDVAPVSDGFNHPLRNGTVAQWPCQMASKSASVKTFANIQPSVIDPEHSNMAIDWGSIAIILGTVCSVLESGEMIMLRSLQMINATCVPYKKHWYRSDWLNQWLKKTFTNVPLLLAPQFTLSVLSRVVVRQFTPISNALLAHQELSRSLVLSSQSKMRARRLKIFSNLCFIRGMLLVPRFYDCHFRRIASR